MNLTTLVGNADYKNNNNKNNVDCHMIRNAMEKK